MNVFHFVLWIVTIVMVAGVIEKYLKTRSQKNVTTELDEDTAKKIDDLEERIRVLERIVTENKFDLRREIDNL